jgi:hypothetical protein
VLKQQTVRRMDAVESSLRVLLVRGFESQTDVFRSLYERNNDKNDRLWGAFGYFDRFLNFNWKT